jgi:hypothetical protein
MPRQALHEMQPDLRFSVNQLASVIMMLNKHYRFRGVYGSKPWASRAALRLTAMLRHICSGRRHGHPWIVEHFGAMPAGGP